VLHVLNVVT